ncbi:MAG: DUF669 domain-containing protein [Pseudomonadota bacterium]
MSGFGYEVNPQEGGEGLTLLAPEEVMAKVEVCEMRPVKNNPAHEYIAVEAMILDGDQAGKKAYINFTVIQENDEWAKWSRDDFDRLTHALGFDPGAGPKDPGDLLGKDFVLKITVKPPKGDKGPSNKFYFKRAGSVAAFTPQAAKPAASAGAAPWKRAANG